MSNATLPREFVPDEESYHMAWSMPDSEQINEPNPLWRHSHLLSVETADSALGLWLSEFRDKHTGLASPPPMS